MPRKTDSNNPSDWLFIAESDLEGLRALAQQEIAYTMCRSKLAEVVEKVMKAELIRLGWFLEKTHDLQKLGSELAAHGSDLMGMVKPLWRISPKSISPTVIRALNSKTRTGRRCVLNWTKSRKLLNMVKARASAS